MPQATSDHLPQRRSIRLRHYDYARQGAYFVTICVHGRRCILGRVAGRRVRPSRFGVIADRCWAEIPRHFPNAELDGYVVMPNHVHGILLLFENDAGTACRAPTTATRAFGQAVADSLATVVGAYKSAVTRQVNADRGSPGARLWQRGYYEHIIRNERELAQVRRYIDENPLRWALDRENPDAAEPDDDLPWDVTPAGRDGC